MSASGRTADDLLDDLRRRLDNDAEHEHAVAAKEQGKINRIRLEKLLGVEGQ